MCTEIIAASWYQENNLKVVECTYGPLKLSWNKHFPGSDKMMLCGQKHQYYEFHRFKIYCTISSHISIGQVHTSQA